MAEMTPEELDAAQLKRFKDAEAILAAPDVGEVGTFEWRMQMHGKQAAIMVMLLDRRISEFDRLALSSAYDHQQRNLDEFERQEQRTWEAKQRTAELELQNRTSELTFKFAETAQNLSIAQAAAADRQSRSLKRATWVLAAATIILALATIALVYVTIVSDAA